ncbi:hypothetical protein lotta81_gp038 [Flavobacterium phage vB_FspM_lotta8-1]|uniref:Uncharacterized protein n=3 Tax=Pippivirus TaxID=2843435 RepID=A0A6B9L978_9CAUD|nr:hypothetical protein HWC85_gp38 [Flavobacterium phage vB_FspM_lotta8-1]YP_009854569.1 hypothetical protein HWC86_gp38 [Flavobacterium phage vB_FspM_pippi8-1]QHB38496.1 hypothetical protein lotta81_gp038 [Flavobacterium phage vB_FspM_lotta8-1]QHB38549.1 hypothetical protein lotta82_gp038 [Flavobacterium phage vB_FspM_lotta8-2]QHB38602.1 hypothetical protein pippi81_gp038 [Flavobacterium phage vB_FspM_pippi8-1]
MEAKNTKKHRYEIEVEGAKAFLAPLSFPVAEAALGFTFRQYPKMITAGEILVNSLFLHGSPKYKNDKKSGWWSRVCLEAYKILDLLAYEIIDERIVVEKDGKKYSCKLSKDVSRDVLEDALGLIRPNSGNPLPLTAGRMILNDCWLEGDEEIKNDHELLICASLAAYYSIEEKEASIKKI